MIIIRIFLLALCGWAFYLIFQWVGWWTLLIIWVTCGIVDVSRHHKITPKLLKNYFLGKGLLTYVLSPINLFSDALSRIYPHVMTCEMFPQEHQDEINDIISNFDAHKDDIIKHIKARAKSKRTMQFFSWYGDPIDQSYPEFNKNYKFIKTIGVSTFQPNTQTSWHFGPLRLSYRILYNLAPDKSEKAFIETLEVKHLWRDSPLFIFDDTLIHRSVNNTEATRYCAFIDIIRPNYIYIILASMMNMVATLIKNYRGVFYKNWDML